MARRKRVTAVEGVTLTIAAGEAVGFLGPNGAGKSTTIKMLTGVLVPTAGRARVCGLDPVRERRALARRIGVVFGQRSQLWWDLPLRESFALHGAIHRVPYADRLDECVELLGHGRVPRDAGAAALAGPAHAGRGDGGAAAPTRAAGARRADHRAGPGEQGAAAGVPRRPGRARRRHAAAHHARPARRRTAVPARRGDRPRSGARGRRPRGAAGPLRRRAGGGGGPGRARPAAHRAAGRARRHRRGGWAAAAPRVRARRHHGRRGDRRRGRAGGAAGRGRGRAVDRVPGPDALRGLSTRAKA